mgnify:CR=1 FL=1
MRAMRSTALQRGVIAVLDVGTSKIGCLILKFEGLEEKIDRDGVGSLAGQSGFQVIGSALTKSRGIEYGEIVSMPETERAIRTALQSAQKLANSRVDHVIACISGGSPRSYGLEGNVNIKPGDALEKQLGENWRIAGKILNVASLDNETWFIAVLNNDTTSEDLHRLADNNAITCYPNTLPYSIEQKASNIVKKRR